MLQAVLLFLRGEKITVLFSQDSEKKSKNVFFAFID